MKIQEYQEGLELNETRHLLIHADNVNILIGNIITLKRNMEPLLEASTEVDLGMKAEKTKCVVASRHQM
jgi:hypothetical protein